MQVDPGLVIFGLGRAIACLGLGKASARTIHLCCQRGGVGDGLAEPPTRCGQIGLRLRQRNLCVGLIEPDKHIPCLHLLGIAHHHFGCRPRNQRRDLRRLRVDIGIVGAHEISGDQHIPDPPGKSDHCEDDGEAHKPSLPRRLARLGERRIDGGDFWRSVGHGLVGSGEG